MKEKTKKKIIVIKLGTSVLTSGTKQLQKERIMELVRQCSRLHKMGYKVIIVTSGAIAAGREYLNYPELPSGIAYKQLLASVGQSRLIQLWEQLFSIYSIKIGQMLLTRADIEHRERFLNARDTLLALLEHEIIPIINENDAVVTAEIKVGDNDTLSALVAILARADLLLLLTDIDGLYTENPQNNKNAQFIKVVPEITEDIWDMAGGSISGLGTGGMTTKIQAANIACSAGINVIIANGGTENSIERIIEGESLGTQFLAHKSPLEERKRWIFGAPATGSVTIDAGATTALIKKGSSLLPIGISDVNGVFSRGEVIKIQNNAGIVIAHGVSRYSSESLLRIAGHHSHEIINLLGYEYGSVIIHRDDMIIL